MAAATHPNHTLASHPAPLCPSTQRYGTRRYKTVQGDGLPIARRGPKPQIQPTCSSPPSLGPPLAETVQDDGLPRARGPKVQKSGLGDRLARKGYSFEIMVRPFVLFAPALGRTAAYSCCAVRPCCALRFAEGLRGWGPGSGGGGRLACRCRRHAGRQLMTLGVTPPRPRCCLQDEEEDEEQGLLGWHPAPSRHQHQYALPGRAAPMALQSRVRVGENVRHVVCVRGGGAWLGGGDG